MEEITVAKAQLPDTIEELSQFVFIGRERLTALKAAIKACSKSEVIVEKLEQMKEEEQGLAEAVLLGETKIGELLLEVPKAKGNQYVQSDNGVGKQSAQAKIGISERTAQRYQVLAKHPEAVKEAIAFAKENDRPVRRTDVINRIPTEPKPTKNQIVSEARDAHREFVKDSASGVIGFEDAIADKSNMEKLTENFAEECNKMLRKIESFGWFREADETEQIIARLTKEDRRKFAERISNATSILCFIGRKLVNDK